MSEDKFYDYSFVKIYLDNKEKYKTLQNFLELKIKKYQKILDNSHKYVLKKQRKLSELYNYVQTFLEKNVDFIYEPTVTLNENFRPPFEEDVKFLKVVQYQLEASKYLLSKFSSKKQKFLYNSSDLNRLDDDVISIIYNNLNFEDKLNVQLTNTHLYQLGNNNYPLLDICSFQTDSDNKITIYSYDEFMTNFDQSSLFKELIFIHNKDNLIYYVETINENVIMYENMLLQISTNNKLTIFEFQDNYSLICSDFYIINDVLNDYSTRIFSEIQKYKYFDIFRFDAYISDQEIQYVIIFKKDNKYLNLYLYITELELNYMYPLDLKYNIVDKKMTKNKLTDEDFLKEILKFYGDRDKKDTIKKLSVFYKDYVDKDLYQYIMKIVNKIEYRKIIEKNVEIESDDEWTDSDQD